AMFITRRHVSRRTFLHGAGAAVALPLLESMLPAATPLAQTAARPRTRLGCIYFPHGATMYKWTPAADGAGFDLPAILQPLAPFGSADNGTSGPNLRRPWGGVRATATHTRPRARFMGGAHAEAGPLARWGSPADQFAARHIGQDTPLPSIELTIEEASTSC